MLKRVFSTNDLSRAVQQMKPFLKSKTLILLDGELGAGKTTLVSALLSTLDYSLASSPTYALRQTYQTRGLTVEHVDLYRLKDDEDIDSTGLWDIFENQSVLVFIEWADRVARSEWPMDWKKYYLKLSLNGQIRQYDFYEA